MAEKKHNALDKMQQIANKLISNTPELVNILDHDSALRPKRANSPTSKKNPKGHSSISSIPKNEMTSNDYHERCRQLGTELQQAKDKIYILEEEITTVKQRFVERQIQYRNIIEELQDQIKSKTSLDQADKNRMQNINQLHKQILNNIGSIQNKTSKILIEQESDIRRYFHKKINEIKEKFKEDKINKTEKDQEYLEREKQMMSELDWIKNIAHKIDLENQTLVKKYSALKSEFEIQEKDKDLLMKELLMKKKENAVLKSQVQQYQKLLNQVSKEIQDNESKHNQSIDFSQELPSNKSRKPTVIAQSKVSMKNQKYDNTISHLNNVISKEKKKVRELKNLYMRQVGNKSELQNIIRKLIDDIRQSIIDVEKERSRKRKTEDELSQQARQKLLEQLLANERILTLIYDKTFYSGARSPQMQKIPEDLEKILQYNDEEGFS